MSDEKSLEMISRKADSDDQEANVEVNTKRQTRDIHYEKKGAFQVRRASRELPSPHSQHSYLTCVDTAIYKSDSSHKFLLRTRDIVGSCWAFFPIQFDKRRSSSVGVWKFICRHRHDIDRLFTGRDGFHVCCNVAVSVHSLIRSEIR